MSCVCVCITFLSSSNPLGVKGWLCLVIVTVPELFIFLFVYLKWKNETVAKRDLHCKFQHSRGVYKSSWASHYTLLSIELSYRLCL